MYRKYPRSKSINEIITFFIIGLILCIGWIINIFKLTDLDFEPNYKAEVIRVVGIIVPPVGGIIGWFDVGEENND